MKLIDGCMHQIDGNVKTGFHVAVRCREAAAGIDGSGTIAAGMHPAFRNHVKTANFKCKQSSSAYNLRI